MGVPPDGKRIAGILIVINMLNNAFGNITVYDSGDDDDDIAHVPPQSKRAQAKASKEYSGLAKVDLTMPLRDENVDHVDKTKEASQQ